MNFSSRTNWHRQLNRLAELLDRRRTSGALIYDLTISNPTECGISYPDKEILAAFSNPRTIHYCPDPRGLISARETVSLYYQKKNVCVDPSDIFLTAGTSEAYSIIFKLLCNGGENVLVPRPSYPLFDYLAQLNDVTLRHYNLEYDDEWQIDCESIANGISTETRAIVLVHPHNPTGMFVKQDEYSRILEIAKTHHLTLIVDEVFIDYPLDDDSSRLGSTAGQSEVLTLTLNGISKLGGLPQMKLGWMVVSGESSVKQEALERLEILFDTFLSVNTPVQVALPKLMEAGDGIRGRIQERIKTNDATLRELVSANTPCAILKSEGGWSAVLRVPKTKTDEEWCLELLEKKGVNVYPGYFFDFKEDNYLVMSLLIPSPSFQQGIRDLIDFVSA